MRIKNDILAVISDCTIDGNVLAINSGQLERKTYMEVNKVIEAIGGKWNRKLRGHVFSEDPTKRLESVLLTGEIKPPKKFGFFPTPPGLARYVVECANIRRDMMVLEPSAGQGALVNVLREYVAQGNIHCIELIPENEAILQSQGLKSQCCDFLSIEPKPFYDRVVMNPPFERQQDIDHVLHAMKCLKPGGRLVSIMSVGIEFRKNRKTVEFRDFVHDRRGWWEHNPTGSFRQSGTNVNTITVVIDNK